MNNRVIKFRVWDKLHKVWLDSYVAGTHCFTESYLTLDGKIQSFDGGLFDNENNLQRSSDTVFYGGKFTKNEDRFVIQRFTGFVDINNKEIYEGDILEGDGTLNSEFLRSSIEFKYGKFVDSKYGYSLDFLAENLFGEYKLKRYGVIGNIFENPELVD